MSNTNTLDHRLTTSQNRTAQRCLRKHELKYIHGLRRIAPVSVLRFGSAFHLGLELYYRGALLPGVLDTIKADYYKQITTAFDDIAAREIMLEWVQVSTLLEAYEWRWRESNALYSKIDTEITFTVPVRNPKTGKASRNFVLAGKVDAIGYDENLEPFLMEHKTTGQDIAMDSDYWSGLVMDDQISNYLNACNEQGVLVNRCLYDVVRKPTINPARLTQGQTATLAETGRYEVKGEDGEYVPCATFEPIIGEDGFIQTVEGEPVIVIPGKKGYAIEESLSMYKARLWRELTTKPDRYFARRMIYRNQAQLTDAKTDLWEWGKIISHCRTNGYWPRSTSGGCIHFGRRCEFFDMCASGEKFNGVAPEGFEILDSVHRELDDPED